MRRIGSTHGSDHEKRESCPRCASQRTIRVDEHYDTRSFFCMDCEHTWTVTIPQNAGAPVLVPSLSPPAHQEPVCASQLPTAREAIRRARATVKRARALVSIATDLLRHVLFTQQRLASMRRAENAVH